MSQGVAEFTPRRSCTINCERGLHNLLEQGMQSVPSRKYLACFTKVLCPSLEVVWLLSTMTNCHHGVPSSCYKGSTIRITQA